MPLRNLLVIKPSSLGDIIHSLIVIQTLKDRYPEIVVDFVVRDRFSELPESCTAVDNVIPFERKGGVPRFFALLKRIREKKYDMVWDMQGLFRSGIMTAFAKADRKIGRFDGRELSGLFCSEKAPKPPDGSPHAIDKLLQYLRTADLEPKPGSQVRFDVPCIDSIDTRLRDSRPIVMIPHSRGKDKEWPGFGELTNRLLEARPAQPIVWDSHIAIESGPFDSRPGFINTSGKTSVAQMIALIQSASLVIANDCGPMHLASAFQIPTIAIFGPTDPKRFGAYPLDSERNVNLRAADGDWSTLSMDEVVAQSTRLIAPQ